MSYKLSVVLAVVASMCVMACADGGNVGNGPAVSGTAAPAPQGTDKAGGKDLGVTWGAVKIACTPETQATDCADAKALYLADNPDAAGCLVSSVDSQCAENPTEGWMCIVPLWPLDTCKVINCKVNSDCDDGNACTTDWCDIETQACKSVADPGLDGTECNDGDACTTGDACSSGTCAGGDPKDCSDGNPCTVDSCDPATGCAWSTPTDCDDHNACTTDSCDPTVEGDCVHDAASMDGKSCDDGSWCTTGEMCSEGTCGGGTAVDCDDTNPCTTDWCNPGMGCTHDDVSAGTGCGVSMCCDGGSVDPDTGAETASTCLVGACTL